ncbi:MAG: hypothetical protein ACTSRU_08265 [Candidatus Hodarchaeales archaeon]
MKNYIQNSDGPLRFKYPSNLEDSEEEKRKWLRKTFWECPRFLVVCKCNFKYFFSVYDVSTEETSCSHCNKTIILWEKEEEIKGRIRCVLDPFSDEIFYEWFVVDKKKAEKLLDFSGNQILIRPNFWYQYGGLRRGEESTNDDCWIILIDDGLLILHCDIDEYLLYPPLKACKFMIFRYMETIGGSKEIIYPDELNPNLSHDFHCDLIHYLTNDKDRNQVVDDWWNFQSEEKKSKILEGTRLHWNNFSLDDKILIMFGSRSRGFPVRYCFECGKPYEEGHLNGIFPHIYSPRIHEECMNDGWRKIISFIESQSLEYQDLEWELTKDHLGESEDEWICKFTNKKYRMIEKTMTFEDVRFGSDVVNRYRFKSSHPFFEYELDEEIQILFSNSSCKHKKTGISFELIDKNGEIINEGSLIGAIFDKVNNFIKVCLVEHSLEKSEKSAGVRRAMFTRGDERAMKGDIISFSIRNFDGEIDFEKSSIKMDVIQLVEIEDEKDVIEK